MNTTCPTIEEMKAMMTERPGSINSMFVDFLDRTANLWAHEPEVVRDVLNEVNATVSQALDMTAPTLQEVVVKALSRAVSTLTGKPTEFRIPASLA